MKEFELESGEHVVLQTRKHWFIFLMELLPYAILMILPLAIPNLLEIAPPLAGYSSIFNSNPALLHMLLGVWFLVIWTGAWGAFTRYFLNVWVLTNQRVVDIKQRGYFNREVSSLFLSRVQDVTTDVVGILPSMLDMGNISVQSAGTVDEFHMRNIPYPERMRDIILKYVSEDIKSSGV